MMAVFDYGVLMGTLKECAFSSGLWGAVKCSASTLASLAQLIDCAGGPSALDFQELLPDELGRDMARVRDAEIGDRDPLDVLQSGRVPPSFVCTLLLAFVRKTVAHGAHLKNPNRSAELLSSPALVAFCADLTLDFLVSAPLDRFGKDRDVFYACELRRICAVRTALGQAWPSLSSPSLVTETVWITHMRHVRVPFTPKLDLSAARPVDWLHRAMIASVPLLQEIAQSLCGRAGSALSYDFAKILSKLSQSKCAWTVHSFDSVRSFHSLKSLTNAVTGTKSVMLQEMLRGFIRSAAERRVTEAEWSDCNEWPAQPSLALVCVVLQAFARNNLMHERYLDPQWAPTLASPQLVLFCIDVMLELLLSFRGWATAPASSYLKRVLTIQELRAMFVRAH